MFNTNNIFSVMIGFVILLVGDASASAQMSKGRLPANPTLSAADNQDDAFRRRADDFIALAMAGEIGKLEQMISPKIIAATGRMEIRHYLETEIRSFFADFQRLGDSITIVRTAGAEGRTFYMYMVDKSGVLRPFVIQVIEEQDAIVVANFIVDQFVAGRHCAKTDGAWQCPDFR